MAAQKLSAAAAALIPDVMPGGVLQDLLLYAYTNERRGGETIASACVAYWDGENAIGLVEENTDVNEPSAQRVPYHPILQSHIDAVHTLADTLPQVLVNDTHLQARVLNAPGGASVVVANRWPATIDAKLATRVNGRQVNLPVTGTFAMAGATGLVLPIDYPLARSRTLVQATAQLLNVTSAASTLALELLAPGGGEVVVDLEGVPASVALNGTSTPFSVIDRGPGSRATVRVTLPAGQSTVTFDL
jgi:hypothetical protein